MVMTRPASFRSASPTLQTALAALEAGISVVPIRPDGTKQPALSGWKRLQETKPTFAEVEEWFRHPRRGIALVTGQVSGNLIAVDFDDEATFLAWLRRIRRDRSLYKLYEEVASGYEERTPKGGRHLLFRCATIAGNQKLAVRPVLDPQRFQTLAETREQGGIIIVDPSRGGVHPSGRPYLRLRGSVSTIRSIDAASRERLYSSIRAFDEAPPPAPCPSLPPASPQFPGSRAAGSFPGTRPGDLFNRDPRVTWESILTPKGWELVRMVDGEGYWRHPGKIGANHSATTNYGGYDYLYVFTPSTAFQQERAYSKFDAYALLYHGGDFKAAAKALAEQGYTTQERSQKSCPMNVR